MENLNKKLSLYFKLLVFCAILFIISFIGFNKTELGTTNNRIMAWGFILFGLAVICIFIISCGITTEIENLKKQYIQNEISERWNLNFECYTKSLSNGDRRSALNYGRRCGFSEETITNDLLCLLNNLK